MAQGLAKGLPLCQQGAPGVILYAPPGPPDPLHPPRADQPPLQQHPLMDPFQLKKAMAPAQRPQSVQLHLQYQTPTLHPLHTTRAKQ